MPKNADWLRALALVAALTASLSGCQGTPNPRAATPPAPTPTATNTSAAAPETAPSASAPPAASTPPVTANASATPCGNLGCLAFASPASAFEHVLASKPAVLAIGEAHAQKGSEAVASTAHRFKDQLLPLLRGRARDLVIELLIANGSCGKAEVKVAEKQRPVTEPQAAGNQNEFIELGDSAKALGIRPHALLPTCDEYNAIASAGAADIDRLLITIADASRRTLLAELDRPAASPAAGLILAYGGALHNDISPRIGRERWSFGPELRQRLGQGYVELDLIVREYVKDTESWRAFPWYGEFAARPRASETLLYSPNPGSFVLIFPSASS